MRQIITSSKLAITIATPLTMIGWAFSPTSFAANSYSLNQLLSSTHPSPQSQQLIAQVPSALRSTKTRVEQIQCTGTKLGKYSNSFPEARVASFDCRFSKNLNLKIYAQNFVILPSGRATPLENAKNLDSMPQPVYFSYKITSWKWNKVPQ
ncbi:MAG: hypothetical protein KME64_34830 [Scytonematopsis contorta HA4267-MV1]|jgi:hypothetical protein|nr:hypothetical protein [Scytonematopsis contorta HA4267-MV1]